MGLISDSAGGESGRELEVTTQLSVQPGALMSLGQDGQTGYLLTRPQFPHITSLRMCEAPLYEL